MKRRSRTGQREVKTELTNVRSQEVAMAIRRVDFNDEAVPATACEFSLIGLQLAYINHSQGSKQHQPAHHATNTTPVGSCNDFSRASVPARQCHPRAIRNFASLEKESPLPTAPCCCLRLPWSSYRSQPLGQQAETGIFLVSRVVSCHCSLCLACLEPRVVGLTRMTRC